MPECIYIHHTCALPEAAGKRVSKALELELQTDVSCLASAGTQIQVLCKSNKSS